MCRALPGSEYYGGSAPPSRRPTRAQPGPRAGRARPGRPGRFPCSLRFARRRRSPALSLRPRHGYAADLHRGLPADIHKPPGSSPPVMKGRVRAAPGPYPPDLSRSAFKRRITLVPRVLLSVTLAGPAPSGSTDTSRLCRGCSRPPRRFPDQAAPSFAALLRQGQR